MIADIQQDTLKTIKRSYSKSQIVSHIESKETQNDIREAMQSQSASEYVNSYEEVYQ